MTTQEPSKNCSPNAFDGMCTKHSVPVEKCWNQEPNSDWLNKLFFNIRKSKQGMFVGIKYKGEKRYHWITQKAFLGLEQAIQAELSKAEKRRELIALKKALRNFVPDTKKYYQDPVKYLEAEIKQIESELLKMEGEK